MAVSDEASQLKAAPVNPIECRKFSIPRLGLNSQRQTMPVTISDTARG